MVVAGGRCLGARAAISGSVMLRTILQPQREDGDDLVAIELPLQQVRGLSLLLH